MGKGGAILIVFLIALVIGSLTMDLASCPKCGGDGELPNEVVGVEYSSDTCPNCGGDGKITIAEALINIVSSNTTDVTFPLSVTVSSHTL